MKIKFNKAFLLCLAAFPLLILSSVVKAECIWGTNFQGDKDRTLSFGTIIVQRDSPVGTVIASADTGTYSDGNAIFTCTTESWILQGELVGFTTLSQYGNNVYDTNLPGVGIRIKRSGNGTFLPFETFPSGNAYLTLPDGGITAELVKTATDAVGAGQLIGGTIGRIKMGNDPQFNVTASLVGANTIIPVACSVNNTVINVSLDDAVIADFKGVGSTAKPKDFNIGLNCDAGTNVKLTLDGNSAGPAGVLSLNAGEHQASGIGIQVLNGTTPVVLGNQLDLGTAGKAGDMQIPLVAQYYQTDASIVAGLTNATATFTMVYN